MKKFVTVLVSVLVPVGASAVLETTTALSEGFYGLLTDTLIPIVFTLALLFFFYGVAKYIRSEGQGKEDGRKIMVWGVVALFVMSSVWALVFFISSELGVQDYEPGGIVIPSITR